MHRRPAHGYYLNDRDPFVQNNSLFNIDNDMIAQQYIEKAREIGVNISQSMVGTFTKAFTFQKANQAVTLGSRSTVKIKCESANVDPQLLCQRMITVRERCEDVRPLFR